MPAEKKMPNRLINEKSPYLLQHAYNPVDWWPWCDESFEKARIEDKPVFLSIGYSTCHWCHVMAHESFEDAGVASILNDGFISIKVDREERPDIDSVYMSACQAVTGSGGWPLSAFMNHDGKPFFAGTYFPKTSRYGMMGFVELLGIVTEKWKNDRKALLRSADEITRYLNAERKHHASGGCSAEKAVDALKTSYDPVYGGFGGAPKFPMPHNLFLLLRYHELEPAAGALNMAEHTLKRMFMGGMFDHIGYGFSRYSTDNKWLAPHFEKMLYDNALLTLAYAMAFKATGDILFREVAEKTIEYVLRELTDKDGGFLSAQDADSDGEEGAYYVFTPDEILAILGGEDGSRFNEYYGISEAGNFEGKNIPNLLHEPNPNEEPEGRNKIIYEYRRQRAQLRTDDKILTSWNGLMIWALSYSYEVFGDKRFIAAARRASEFIDKHMSEGGALIASYRDGKTGARGFLDDYAFYALGILALYNAALERRYIERARELLDYAVEHFFDKDEGGFYLYESGGERLIARPKEVYDGAIPSGNSALFYALTIMNTLTGEYADTLEKQRAFMQTHIEHPMGHSLYFFAELPLKKIVCVQGKNAHELNKADPNAVKLLLEAETEEYRRINGKTTYYVCDKGACRAPVNEINQ